MPFGRSHARSKSRSPAPYSPAVNNPPSSHLTAVGVPHTSNDSLGETAQVRLANSSLDDASSAGSAETQSSQLSTMGKLMKRVPSKRFTVSLMRSDSRGDREMDSRDQRKSQLGNIPLLETHLLPSLRDTVERMTQSPQSRSDFGDAVSSHSTPSSRMSMSRMKHSNIIPSPSTSSWSPPKRGMPRTTPDSTSTTNLPRFQSAVPPLPKSALKSSARRVDPLPPQKIQLDEPFPPPDSPGTYLRSDPGRSGTMPLPSSPNATPRIPTALPRLKTRSKSKSNPNTPQPHGRSSTFATPQFGHTGASPLSQSSLPRPKITRSRPYGSSESGSELERRIIKTLTPGRLVVTNAIIVSSSSESEDESTSRSRQTRWIASSRRGPVAANITPRSVSRPMSRLSSPREKSPSRQAIGNSTVGLGFQVGGIELGKQGKGQSSDSDSEGMYDEEFSDDSLLDEPVLFSPHDDAESIYEDDPPPDFTQRTRPLRVKHKESPQFNKRHQDTVVGLVDGSCRGYSRNSSLKDSSSKDGSRVAFNASAADMQGIPRSDLADLQQRSPGGRTSSLRTTPRSHTDQLHLDWEGESTYSDDGTQGLKTPEPSRLSLRQSRNQWERPSAAFSLHPDQRPSPAYSDRRDRRCSKSPMISALSPHSGSPNPKAPSSPPSFSTISLPDSHSRSGGSRIGDPGHTLDEAGRLRSACSPRSPRRSNILSGSGCAPEACKSLPSARTDLDCVRLQDDAGIRERLAFGIPESLSYCGSDENAEEDESFRPPLSRLSSTSSTSSGPVLQRADTDRSVVETGWRELSKGAAALFQTLTSGTKRSKSRNEYDKTLVNGNIEHGRTGEKISTAELDSWASGDTSSCSPGPPDLPDGGRVLRRRSLDSASTSSRSSPGSIYEASPVSVETATDTNHPPAAPVVVREVPSSWKSNLSPDLYASLRKQHGAVEMDRQELINELFTSDKTFIKSARNVIRTSFLPLRTRDSRSWLPGLPPDVARLFDWLEDIVNLHTGIARALAAVVAVWKSGAIVERVAGVLKTFVPQLEVYMPYLVKLDGMREAVLWYVEQDEGEFGQYLRMKDKERAEDEWTLERLVEEPIQRLARYLELFQRLHELTPRGHPDHLATISLLYSTRMAVHVMEQVKAREQEYDFVKDLTSRIDGLSHTVPLARRARRLLWHGTLLWPEPAADTPKAGPTAQRALPMDPLLSPHPDGTKLRRQPAQRGSKLMASVWDRDMRRSHRRSISSSSFSAVSVQTFDMPSSASEVSALISPRFDDRVGLNPGRRPGALLKNIARMGRVPSQDREEFHARSPSAGESRSDTKLNIIVFTDLIVLALSNADVAQEGEAREKRSRLLRGVGLSRIINFTEGEGTVTLDLVSVRPSELDGGLVCEDTGITPIALSVPPEEEDRRRLLSAISKCYHHTVRSLSFPSQPGAIMEDPEIDTRQSLVGILSSGLPLPKSPSIQFEEAAKGLRRDAVDGEREERGWWTLRFHQVLRELQREEVPASLATPCVSGVRIAL